MCTTALHCQPSHLEVAVEVAAYEVLVVTNGIANLIRENKTFRITSAIQTGAKFGMQLMDDALFNLWKDGKVVIEDILAKSHRPDDLARRIVNARKGIEDDSTIEDMDDAGGH